MADRTPHTAPRRQVAGGAVALAVFLGVLTVVVLVVRRLVVLALGLGWRPGP